MDQIILQPYSEEWGNLFSSIAKKIREELGEAAIRIDHIGSTSISGLAAKPIIDIQISVKSLDNIDEFRLPLERLGYVYKSDNPDKTKRYFREKIGRAHV